MSTPEQDFQWPTYEVFSQRKRGEAHQHVGSVHATDPEMALIMARDQFARREKIVQIWVVATSAIYATPYDEFDIYFAPMDKDYREAANFRVGDMIRDWETRQTEEGA